ncbi:hypothetical protein JCM10212_001892 [Sporobolomyces blumeae]
MRRISTPSRSVLARAASSSSSTRPALLARPAGSPKPRSSRPLTSQAGAVPHSDLAPSACPRSGVQTRAASTATSTPAPSSASTRKPLFSKVLIANRGEIAVRIIKTCRKLGIKTVAVFSEVDRDALHVKMADEAYLLGPAPSHLSYLNIPRLLEICHHANVEAVHPGYGFMSENAEFARQLEKEGITFVGPPVEAIVSMGSKAESKDIMRAADVPCIPGWHPSTTSSSNEGVDTQSAAFLIKEADKIGYPVLIKAVSGGGGKGMKIVEKREEFESQLESAKREGRKSFGDDTVLLERYVQKPRHVEVQIFSDSHGNHLSLFERDCSVQRRHQKVIEEAPAPNLSQDVRERLYETARKAAKAVGYRGAGTVEFVLNADNPAEFFFLEVNTRLQVEHPVTEAITGVDLVEWQLEVAAGNAIPLRQDEIECNGHAFEVRVYAENPRNNFLPDTGTLLHVKLPKESDYVRLETGFEAGDEISVYYDPLIAKLIVHGPNRREALKRLRKALGEYQIVGPATNLEFLTRLSENEAFRDEDLDTGFIPRHHDALFPPVAEPSASTLASAALYLSQREMAHFTSLNATSPWTSSSLAGFRLGEGQGNRYTRRYETDLGPLEVSPAKEGVRQGGFDVTVPAPSSDGGEGQAVLSGAIPKFSSEGTYGTSDTVTTLFSNATLSRVDVVSSIPTAAQTVESNVAEKLHLFNESEAYGGSISVSRPKWMKDVGTKKGGSGGAAAGAGAARSPMPSKIVEVKVKAGDVVEEGQTLVIVEAMKMEHVLKAPKAGTVESVTAKEGDLVPEGKVLVSFVTETPKGDESRSPRYARSHLLPVPRPSVRPAIRPFLACARPLGLVRPAARLRVFAPLVGRLPRPGPALHGVGQVRAKSRTRSATPQVSVKKEDSGRAEQYVPYECLSLLTGLVQPDKTASASQVSQLAFQEPDDSLVIHFPTVPPSGRQPSTEVAPGKAPYVTRDTIERLARRMVDSKQATSDQVERAKERMNPFVVEKGGVGETVPVATCRNVRQLEEHVGKRGFEPPQLPGGARAAEPTQSEEEGPLPDKLVTWLNVRRVARNVYPRNSRGNDDWILRKLVRRASAGNMITPADDEHPLGQAINPDKLGAELCVSWFDIAALERTRARRDGDRADVPSRLSTALEHFFDVAIPHGRVYAIDANSTASHPPKHQHCPAPPRRDLFLRARKAAPVLRELGIVPEGFDNSLQGWAELKVIATPGQELSDPRRIRFDSRDRFERRLETLFTTREQRKLAFPWRPPTLPASASTSPTSTTETKGTKRMVQAVERTQGQLATPAPSSAESTPEPVPPPLKRARSSQIVSKVSSLSLASAPPTPVASPRASPEPTLAPVPAPSAPATLPVSAQPQRPTPTSLNDPVDLADAKLAASKSFELETLRLAYSAAQEHGGASFLALDVEFWERDHDVLTEFGWSVVEFVKDETGTVKARREDQHAVIKENQRFRNGRFSPDARDHFDFGRTLVLPSGALYYLLHALFATLSATHPLFLVFHDPRGDLKALKKLGFDPSTEFEPDLKALRPKAGQKGKGVSPAASSSSSSSSSKAKKMKGAGRPQGSEARGGGGIYVVDTQRVFAAWLGRKSQIGLEKACKEIDVPTRRLHNAGNDAHYTLALLEKLMDRSLVPSSDSPLVRFLDERAAAAKVQRLAASTASAVDRRETERNEQAKLERK